MDNGMEDFADEDNEWYHRVFESLRGWTSWRLATLGLVLFEVQMFVFLLRVLMLSQQLQQQPVNWPFYTWLVTRRGYRKDDDQDKDDGQNVFVPSLYWFTTDLYLLVVCSLMFHSLVCRVISVHSIIASDRRTIRSDHLFIWLYFGLHTLAAVVLEAALTLVLLWDDQNGYSVVRLQLSTLLYDVIKSFRLAAYGSVLSGLMLTT